MKRESLALPAALVVAAAGAWWVRAQTAAGPVTVHWPVALAISALVGALVFLTFRPLRPERGARYALLAAGLLVLVRLLKPETVQDRWQWSVVLASDVLIACVGAFLLTALVRTIGAHRRRPPTEPSRLAPLAALFALFVTPLTLWFIGEWPGHAYFDERMMFAHALRFDACPWLSTLYSVYAVSIVRVFGQYTAIGAVNILLISWVLADFFSLLLARGVRGWAVLLFAGLAATSIPLAFLAMNMTHDILTAFLKIALLVAVLKAYLGAPTAGVAGVSLWGIGALTWLVSVLRGENLVLLLYVPVLLIVARLATVRAVLVLAACLAGATLLYQGGVRRALEGPGTRIPDMGNRYVLYLMCGPVGFMVQHRYFTTTPEEDRRDIAAAFEYERFVADYNALNYLDYAESSAPIITDEVLRGFRRVYVTSALNNPGLFLANRVMVLVTCAGGSPGIWHCVFPRREAIPEEKLGPAPYSDLFRATAWSLSARTRRRFLA